AAEARYKKLAAREAELKEQLNNERTERLSIDQKLKEATKALIQAESRLSSLKEINASLEGLKEGSREFLKATPEGFELLGTLVRCDERYGKAVQALLSGLLDVVVATGTGDKQLGEWLLANPEAGIDFLVGGDSQSL